MKQGKKGADARRCKECTQAGRVVPNEANVFSVLRAVVDDHAAHVAGSGVGRDAGGAGVVKSIVRECARRFPAGIKLAVTVKQMAAEVRRYVSASGLESFRNKRAAAPARTPPASSAPAQPKQQAATLQCAACQRTLPRFGGTHFSTKQRKKGADARCKECMSLDVGGTAREKTEHLHAQQAARNVDDAALAEAVKHGDRVAHPDDGTVHYIYKNVVFVADAETGTGITCWRRQPAQCTCKINPDSVRTARSFEEDDRSTGRHGARHSRGGHNRRGITRIALKAQMAKFARARATAAMIRGEAPPNGFISDPMYAAADVFAKIDFGHAQWRDVFQDEEYMQGQALVLAAGPMLVPVRCRSCLGIERLQICEGGDWTKIFGGEDWQRDESEALRWVQELLDNAEERVASRGSARQNALGRDAPLIDYSNMFSTGGMTPLAAAARYGRYRICVELLKRGAKIDAVDSGTVRFLLDRALYYVDPVPVFKNMRIQFGQASFADILLLLARGFTPPDEKNMLVHHNAASFLRSFEQDGAVGFLWDGFRWRLRVRNHCTCKDLYELARKKGLRSGRFKPSTMCVCAGEGAHVVHIKRFLVVDHPTRERCRSGEGNYRYRNELELDADPLLDPAVKRFLSGHSKKWPDKRAFAKYGGHFSRGGSTFDEARFRRANNGAGGGGRRNVPPPSALGYMPY